MESELKSLENISHPSKVTFAPLSTETSYSQFLRNSIGSSATSIAKALIPGTFLEIQDNRFGGDHLIILRRSDFDRLLKISSDYSEIIPRITKILFTIGKSTVSFPASENNDQWYPSIEIIRTQAELGLDLTKPQSVYPTTSDFFRAEYESSKDDDSDFDLPQTKEELMNGVSSK